MEKQREYELKVRSMEDAKEQWMKQFELDKFQKQKRFVSVFEKAKIEKEGRIRVCQIEAYRAAVATLPVTQTAHNDKRYIHKLPRYYESDSLYVFLSRFTDSMRAAEIPEIQ